MCIDCNQLFHYVINYPINLEIDIQRCLVILSAQSFTFRWYLVSQIETCSLQWRHNERDGVSNHQLRDCLLNRLYKAQIKENIKAPRHWPLWGEFTGDWLIPRTNDQ